ncbi:hypothetical protein B0H63DRAFT_41556 [Podospora didyma]|uniref:Nitrogen regulatory protein areA GATA-like domain-containing protein n=1 Tax=Podospora didyma TaxID=330526 RepID=A0AAE0U825_9PEZI|nr:hypothetical protein B0H63DRAFT_41556 [Podospora didyma]
MAMLLPKGLVENTREIYAEVASYPTVPPEKIWQYWNVYTTTFRRLVDPTAYRLENFWWHVWGSDRRNLSGPALAKLFEQFSDGPTFVPLKGPANRYEGPTVRGSRPVSNEGQLILIILVKMPRFTQEQLDMLNSDLFEQRRPSQGRDTSPSKSSKSPTPSSSRPPPPHPILKKTRGPSASGPRPTARFVSPPPSGDEDEDDDEGSAGIVTGTALEMPPPPPKRERAATLSAPVPEPVEAPKPTPALSSAAVQAPESRPTSLSSLAPAMEMRPPPTPPSKSRGATPTRKIVASSAASKRRPVLPRRQSSQSSTGSNTGIHEITSAMATSTLSGNQRAATSIAEHPSPRRSSQESAASSSSVTMSAKAAGKRPARSPAKRSTPRNSPAQPDGLLVRPVVVQQTLRSSPAQGDDAVSVRSVVVQQTPQRRSTWDVRDNAASNQSVQARESSPRGLPPVAGFVTDVENAPRPPRMERSRSNIESPLRPRETGHGRPQIRTLLATSVVATSNMTVQGQFDSEVTPTSTDSEARDIPDDLMQAARLSSTTVLESPFTPTRPNPAPAIPFGRSKSQLTLLLEREKTRNGEGR